MLTRASKLKKLPALTQSIFTYFKLTIGTPEQYMKSAQSEQ